MRTAVSASAHPKSIILHAERILLGKEAVKHTVSTDGIQKNGLPLFILQAVDVFCHCTK